MVDVLGLGQLNPNFNDYVPSTADPEYDDGSSNVTEDGFDLSTIDENRKLKLLPYVYIFSFVCKNGQELQFPIFLKFLSEMMLLKSLLLTKMLKT